MATRPDSQPSDRPTSWPAWCTSLAVHAGILAALLYLVRQQMVEGAAEVASRDVGIVLKRMTEDGPLFEDERNRSNENKQVQNQEISGNSTLDALPSAAEIHSTDATLQQLPALGSETPEVGDARAMAQGGPASKAIGGEATVRVFGIEGTGSKFVYVFDRSISMEGSPLRTAKRQLIASLASLESVHQFQIIFFNHEPQVWDLTGGQQRIAFATDANKRLAENFVRSITASGGTYRLVALQSALRLSPDVIFFLTDADDPMPASDVVDCTRHATNNGIAIHTIEFGIGQSGTRENFLIQLARGSSGRHVYVNTQQLER